MGDLQCGLGCGSSLFNSGCNSCTWIIILFLLIGNCGGGRGRGMDCSELIIILLLFTCCGGNSDCGCGNTFRDTCNSNCGCGC